MKTLSVKIPERLAAKLETAARKTRVSRSELIRKLLQKGLESGDQESPSAYELMREGIGMISSGHPDLATGERHMDGFGT
ncbi:MAG TPA: CopG family transcriptional regulator [Rhodothermia bacterium]